MLTKFKRNVVDLFIGSVSNTLSADLSGTATVNSSCTAVTGTGTNFTSDFKLDDFLYIGTESRQIALIANNTRLTVASPFSSNASANTYKKGKLENVNYYVFAARQSPYQNDGAAANTIDNNYDGSYFVHDELMFGKKVTAEDVVPVIAKKQWQSNTIYAEYDDKDNALIEKDFYIVTSENKVYKCIHNEQNSRSTIEPTHTETGFPPSEVDNYRWMYMYQITNEQILTFGTENYIPVIENQSVKKTAIDGAIFNMVVEANGSTYPADSGTILTTDSTSTIRIRGGSATSNGFFSNCGVVITNEATNQTYVKEIRDYISNTNGNFVIVKIPFANNEVSNNNPYSIGPFIKIDSKTGSNCIAYPIMQNVSNTTFTGSVKSIEIVNPGKNYKQANVAVQTAPAYGSGAIVRVIISPPGGHGSNVEDELYCQAVGVGVEFSNSATFSFSSEVEFRTVGVIKNPLAAVKTTPSGVVDLVANSLAVTGSSTRFTSEVNIGDHIVYSDEEKEVVKVENDTSLTLKSPFSYTVVAEPFKIRKRFSSTHFNQTVNITAANTTPILLTIGEFAVGSDGAGGGSQIQGKVAFANSSKVILTGVDYDQCRGNTAQTILLNDVQIEGVGYIVQGADTPSIDASGAKYSKVASNGTNANGAITTAPDLKLYSGEIMYLQNLLPIQRSNTTNEQIRLVIKF